MPITITAAEAVTARAAAGSDLLYLLGAESVDTDTQNKFFHVGVTSVPKLSVFAKDEVELKDLLKTEFELDASVDISQRVKIGNVLIAFQRAQSRTIEESKLDAEFTAKRLTRPLKSSDYSSMRAGWENRWWKLDDKNIPARSYLEERCDELEGGDFHVESLSKVISREEDSEPSVQTFFDGTGKLQIKKGSTEVALPTTPEQLRYRVKLWGTGIQMIGIKHSNQPCFQNLSPQDIEDYLSFLLGEFVWGLTGKTAEGLTVSAPAWGQLLVYEQQIRKRMYNLMMEGTPAVDALKAAFKDPVVKERYFTTPTALSATTRQPYNSFDKGGKSPGGKGQGKGGKVEGKGKGKGAPYGGKSKGKGKGKGKEGKDGKGGTCFPYNNHWETCTRQNCPFAHRCSRCGGKHPAYRCQNQGSETQGDGAAVPPAAI